MQPAELDLNAVRRADPGRDGRPDRVSAHRRPAVLPDARPVRVVLVHAAARAAADDAATPRPPTIRTRRSPNRCRRCSSASTGRTCSTAARARVLERQALRAVPAAAALVRVQSARDPAARASPTGRRCASGPRPGVPRRSSSVEYADGWTESYLVPLALVVGRGGRARAAADARRACSRASPARARAPSSTACSTTTRAIACSTLVRPARRARDQARQRSRHASSGEHVRSARPEHKWVRGGGDQSNSIAFVNDRYALKLFRRIEPARNPEFEIGRFLTARGFTRTPALVGALEYDRAGPRAGHARGRAGRWSSTRAPAGNSRSTSCAATTSGSSRARSQAHRRQPVPAGRRRRRRRRFSRRSNTGISRAATTLGRRTAELHLALAQRTDAGVRSGAARSRRARRARRRHARRMPQRALDLLARRLGTAQRRGARRTPRPC